MPSPTALARHLACRHVTQLDALERAGTISLPPRRPDPTLDALIERGNAHEAAYVEHLRAAGKSVVEISSGSRDRSATLDAMRAGADVIVQAPLRLGDWFGYADLLLRVDTPSALGDYSYEAADTKLARETRGGTILQLALYTHIVSALQETNPARMHVIKPGRGDDPFVCETYVVSDFAAYFRWIRGELERSLAADPRPETYPDPVDHCNICRWWPRCDKRRRDDDHLSFVAGVRKQHIAELARNGVTTLEAWGDATEPVPAPPERGHIDTYEKLHAQARLQLRGRREEADLHELLDAAPGMGLARLPEPSSADVFFDFEGDPFALDDGLEYLFGWALIDGDEPTYHSLRALDRAAEKRAFERFIDFVVDRWSTDDGMHVYHFGHYEPSALKRLVGRHATRSAELDTLLRGGRFVDLHAIARQGVRCSVERYTLKDLERFAGFTRATDLRDASAALRRVECAIESAMPSAIDEDDLRVVEHYNREDCLATLALRDWLEARRAELIETGAVVERPTAQPGDPTDKTEERDAKIRAVAERLTAALPDDPDTFTPKQRATWTLAHMLGYFRREENCAWWEFFRRKEADIDELRDDRKAVVGLDPIGRQDTGTAACPVDRYAYPEQEVSFSEGDDLHEPAPEGEDARKIGKVHAIDEAARTIDVKKTKAEADHHPTTLFTDEFVSAKSLENSLLALGESVADHGIDGDGPHRAGRELLLRMAPRITGHTGGPLRHAGEQLLDATKRLVRALDASTLPVQGPPGSGKTYCGARAIVDLVQRGKRVGVTAVSHRVIRNLLDNALEAAVEMGTPIEAVHKPSSRGNKTDPDDLPDGLTEQRNGERAIAALNDGAVVGGTAWLWSSAASDDEPIIDTLFIDEAGQMSLAHVLAVSRAAKNLVLLGDPQQLEQPQKGAHPDGTDVAALDHVLGEDDTIPNDRGLLLDETRRLAPKICAFTSALYYDDRLSAHEWTHGQCLIGDTPFQGSGLFHVPVEHTGNQAVAAEEVEAIRRIVDGLLASGTKWIDQDGEEQTLTEKGILVVAPYNAQVGALCRALPDAVPVGTVDKFQGQEAPIVIYSMTTSTPEDAPRGMAFLYSPNRLNVATSRARCATILVAAPALFTPDCRTPDQMRYANGLCYYREQATTVTV